ncbi:hypothetical protein FQN60_002056 [Etheostoma spectabile]|uniref:HAT C-terminal dimerisation domain-containing protein n=1 Tax=Etheostoma spectabile TaxID=54343 RepID=A0A5J5DCL9_9PERO|nr:hypothetical protein FQN60_002056 [Etheostoma spectabile]
MEKDGMAVPVLSDPKWLLDLGFLVDITQELNVLNRSYKAGAACQCVPMKSLSDNPLLFPSMQGLMDVGTSFSSEKYADAIMKLQEEFDRRLADFKTHRALFKFLLTPFLRCARCSSCTSNGVIDLQCNSELKVMFRKVSGNADKLGQFLRELHPPSLSSPGFQGTMCLFGSTYLCEKLFSTMKLISQSTGPDY